MKSTLPWERNSRIEGSQIFFQGEREKRQSLMFKKYFPKYVKELSLKHIDRSTIIKIKSLQRISYFNSSKCLISWRKLKQILGNKVRLVKSLQNNPESQKTFADRVKLFPNLESITIQIPCIFSSKPPLYLTEEIHLMKAIEKMRFLKNLKALEIRNLSKEQRKLIEKLDSSPRLLRSLNVLCSSDEYSGYFSSAESELIQILQRNKTLLNYITKLDLGILCSDQAFANFQGFANACSNLESFSLAFHCRDTRIVGKPWNVKVNYLKIIETFQNLKFLDLHIGDIVTFLKDFSAPLSLKSLRLAFEEHFSKEIMQKIESTSTEAPAPNIFEENDIFLGFYQKLQQLKNLIRLKLLFNRNSDLEAFSYQSYFVQSFLKRLSAIEKLALNPLCSLARLLEEDKYHDDFISYILRKNQDGKPGSEENRINDPYLPEIFQSFGQFSQTFESLQIGSEITVYKNVDLSPFYGKFPKLSKVRIFWNFKENGDREKEISEFLSQIILLGDALKTIKIDTLVRTNAKVLLSVLRQIKHFEKPENLQKFELNIAFSRLEEFGSKGFNKIIGELKNEKKVKGVCLKLYKTVFSERMRKFLEAYGGKFESLECCCSSWEDRSLNSLD